MAQTFTWQPLTNPIGKHNFRTLTAQFGDGYVQEVSDGINNLVSSWQLSFQDMASGITPIVTFLNDHRGYKPFKWTPPLSSVSKLYVVKEYDVQVIAGACPIYRLTATFEERFDAS